MPGYSETDLSVAVSKMTETLAHRGPDGSGSRSGPGWAVGHRRLAIIDLVDGAQPMSDERGFTITYNGELYNYRELRSQLEALGETFRTRSDTEVVLRAYARWSEDCLSKLNGMFAFAVFSPQGRELFLARDRIGIKPLYYALVSSGLVFGSEIKAVLASQFVNRDVDVSMLPYYLVQGYLPRESTPFKNVRQLLPGHWLRVRNGSIESACYWSISSCAGEPQSLTGASQTELLSLISDAVQKQTVADVPVGVLLSGGIDSGIVTASLSRVGKGLSTFTVSVPDDPRYDEADLAREVASRFDTHHCEMPMNAQRALSIWERVIDHFDQPFGDESALSTFMICETARPMVKVVLSGDGGDEQWGGYQNYRRYQQLMSWRCRVPVRPTVRTTRTISTILHRFLPRSAERLRFYGNLLAVPVCDIYRYLDAQTCLLTLEQLVGERLRDQLQNGVPVDRDPASTLDEIMRQDLQTFMVDAVLRKVDMMSMAVGLEVRVPLLDHRIVEKSVQIRCQDKVTTRETKAFMRRLLRKELPKRVIRGKKKGFGVPLNSWFRGPLKDPMCDLLLSQSSRKRGILNPTVVQAVIDDHMAGRAEYGKLIYSMVSLERWLCRYDH